jgi:predicted XRE-type DNA-binding protein
MISCQSNYLSQRFDPQLPQLGLTQAEASAIRGIKHPHASALMGNRSGNFSVERLMDFLIVLGQDVEITVRPTRKKHGQLSIVLA